MFEPRDVLIDIESSRLPGILAVPDEAVGLVIFVHGSGSSRYSPRNLFVANQLQQAGLATLLFDLLTEGEERDRGNVFDIGLLADRLQRVAAWVEQRAECAQLPIGLFGASTGAAAALVAAAAPESRVRAVVSRGGRPDLAESALALVSAPTLLVVGALDSDVLRLNQEAADLMHCPHEVLVIAGATHLFEEAGTLDQVAAAARAWFLRYLRSG